MVDNEWMWAYSTHGPAGHQIQVAGDIPRTGTNAWSSFTSPGDLLLATFIGELAEIIWWDDILTASELAQLIKYFNVKYGPMPF